MAKRTFEITFKDDMFSDKSQEVLQRNLYVAIEEYLLYTNNLRDGVTPEEAEPYLNLRVREEKWKKD